MNDISRYQWALDDLYSGYMQNSTLVAGLFDREFKNPNVILDVARNLTLLPNPDQVVKITGSKGKGSTSRLIAFYLRQTLGDAARVALFVSPEEFEHTDRMTISGEPISQREFADAYDFLRPHLDEARRRLSGVSYLSPFGIMLLIALVWFQNCKASWYVLETGRGAAHDEVGMLPGKLALITSILLEHPGNLGPSIRHVAAEKIAIAQATTNTIFSSQADAKRAECLISSPAGYVQEDCSLPLRLSLPKWLALDDRLARQAIRSLLPVNDAQLLACDIDGVSAAWGTSRYKGIDIVYDAMINLESLDRVWFDRTFSMGKTLILYSLPDDKDRPRLKAFVEALPRTAAREIILLGKRVYLKYDEAEKEAEEPARIHYEDRAAFLDVLSNELALHQPTKVYCFGTQTFIRLVKAALAPQLSVFRRNSG